MTDEEVRQLKEKAEAATAGPWRIRQDWHGDKNILVDCGDPAEPWTVGNIASVTSYAPYMSLTRQQQEQQAEAEANAEFIAAANPQTVLRLCEELERARAEGEGLRRVAEAARVCVEADKALDRALSAFLPVQDDASFERLKAVSGAKAEASAALCKVVESMSS